MSKNTIICTTGTSLLNIVRQQKAEKNEDDVYQYIKTLEENEKLCGAEINSNYSLMKAGHIDELKRVYFCVSDTEDGEFVGKVLKRYYDNKYKCKTEVMRIENLKSDDYKKFKNHGLKNLLKVMSEIILDRKNGFEPIINATGGFKAQISFAGLIGQMLGVSVYYQFENFKNIIEMPPMPVSFNNKLWSEYADMFYKFDKDSFISKEDFQNLYGNIDKRIMVLLDSEREDNKEYYCLSAMGQLFHEGFTHLYQMGNDRPDKAEESERTGVKLSEVHKNYPKGTENFLKKIYDESNYIKRIEMFWYQKNKTLPINFKASTKAGDDCIEGTFNNSKTSCKYYIYTTAKNQDELNYAINDLQVRYGD